MPSLPLVHLMLVCMWLGLVLGETAIEFAEVREESSLRLAARLHYLIDVFVEIPLVLAVLTTGAILTWQRWPLSTLVLVKIICGLVAISANLFCGVLVIQRYRQRDDAQALRRLSRRVRTAWGAVPFGLAALYLGLSIMR